MLKKQLRNPGEGGNTKGKGRGKGRGRGSGRNQKGPNAKNKQQEADVEDEADEEETDEEEEDSEWSIVDLECGCLDVSAPVTLMWQCHNTVPATLLAKVLAHHVAINHHSFYFLCTCYFFQIRFEVNWHLFIRVFV